MNMNLVKYLLFMFASALVSGLLAYAILIGYHWFRFERGDK